MLPERGGERQRHTEAWPWGVIMVFGAFYFCVGHWFSSNSNCRKLLRLDGWWEIRSQPSVGFLNVFAVIGLTSWKAAEGWEGQQVRHCSESKRGFYWDWRRIGARVDLRRGHLKEGGKCLAPLGSELVRVAGILRPVFRQANVGTWDRELDSVLWRNSHMTHQPLCL